MSTQISECSKCGNRTSFSNKKSFLGFSKLVCTECKNKFNDPSTPLSKGYRIIYWVLGILFTLVLINKIPTFIAAANQDLELLFHAILEQWPPILFVVGAIWALWKDAIIRKSK